jgi:acyl-CoA synthetase (AMP-forming)/AMP-acid ligase II
MIDELSAALRRDDNRPAIVGTTRNGRTVVAVTRGELAAMADRYAGGLHMRGLNHGDTIGVAVRPSARSLAILLAARTLGLRVAALDPTAGPDVLLARIALAHPKLVLADAAAQAAAGWAKPLARKAAHIELPRLEAFDPVATVGRRLPGCAPALYCSGCTAPIADYGRSGDAVIVFTSGTTAKPRAVVHTWASLHAGMRAVTELVRPLPGEPVLGGTMFVLVPALAAGAPVALPARSGRGIARQLRQLQPQATYLTPLALRAALAAGANFTGRVWSGSAPVSATLLARVKQAGATQAYGVYALTELFPADVVEAADKAGFDEPGDLVGEPVPGVRVRVEASGQLYLTGLAACDRYLGEPARRWVATGDVARLHRSDGGPDHQVRVVLAGRSKDMILRAAENIYPGLYEPALHVPGVGLAVLVGVPAADGDERVAAVVELEPGADRDRVRAALLERFGRMGSARPDVLLFAPVPLGGRSRKPDRQAAAALVAVAPAQSIEPIGGTTSAAKDCRRPS